MSLFEKLNNKRYNLQEKKIIKKLSSNSSGNKKDPLDDVLSDPDLNKAKKTVNKQLKQTGDKISTNSADPNRNITKTLSDTTKGGKIERSVDARVITKKFNEKNPNRPEYVKPEKFKAAETITKKVNKTQQRPLGQLVKKTKPSTTAVSGKLTPGQIDFSKAGELAAKRKARINTSTGKATQSGVFDFAKNRGGFNRMSQGMSKSDFTKMISSDPKKASQFKSVVTKAKNIASNPASKEYKKIADTINKSDYAGKFAKKDPKIAKMNTSQKAANLAKIKSNINAKNPTYVGKSGGLLPVKGTVLKRSNTKSGFERVLKKSKEGQKIFKKLDYTGFKEPPKSNLSTFQKLKKKLTTGWKIPKKDWDLKTIRGPQGNAISQTRRSFKPGVIGTLRKNIAKLPNRYKYIAGAIVLASQAPTIKKTFFAPKAEPKTYRKYQKPLGFDTGKQNISRKLYKKNLEKRDPEQYKKEFPKKLPQSMNPYNKPTPLPTQKSSNVNNNKNLP